MAIGSGGVQQPLPALELSNIVRARLPYLTPQSREVASGGVIVNMVSPSRIDTDGVCFLDEARAQREGTAPEEVQSRSRATIHTGCYGQPI